MSDDQFFTISKIQKVFGSTKSRNTFVKAENANSIPKAIRSPSRHRKWAIEDIPKIGEKYGFMSKLKSPKVVALFITKGGVLKSTLALNIARMAALHNIRTVVVGLDMQGDITSSLGFDVGLTEDENLESAKEKIESIYGLPDLLQGKTQIEDLLIETNIPTLSFIPETPELTFLEKMVSLKGMRDFWLENKVIQPLKEHFDLILLDCSPNWNMLISNALVSCDVLISPLECKINHFRNLQSFRTYIDQFKEEMKVNFDHIYVPIKYSNNKKLRKEIRSYYMTNIPECLHGGIRDSQLGDDAMATCLSVPEFSPSSPLADEVREVIKEIWAKVCKSDVDEESYSQHKPQGDNLHSSLTC